MKYKPMQEESKAFRTFFYHDHGNQIRTVEHNGETWWIAGDMCKVLEITNVGQAVSGDERTGHVGLDDDEKDGITICDAIGRKQAIPYVPVRNETELDEDEKRIYLVNTSGGPRATLCINESGLYRLIAKSQKPEAKTFQRWVYHEVLPAIRKTGRYSLAQPKYQKDYVGISETIGRGQIIEFISEVAMVAKYRLCPQDIMIPYILWTQLAIHCVHELKY